MATKKTAKSLLEYDPLSWLKEDNGEKTAKAGKKKTSKKAATRKVASKKTLVTRKAKPVKVKAKKQTQGKKQSATGEITLDDQVPASNAESPEKNIPSVAAVEDVNFGFFDDEPAGSSGVVLEPDAGGNIINLGVELTIKNVADIKQRIETNLADDLEIKLDPVDLQKIDACGLQMLYSLHKTLAKSSQRLHWQSRNTTLESAAELIGMGHLMDATSTDSPEQNQGFGFF